MRITVESRRKKLESVQKLWPGAVVIDVTSKGVEPWVRFSPFYPHGKYPNSELNGVGAIGRRALAGAESIRAGRHRSRQMGSHQHVGD